MASIIFTPKDIFDQDFKTAVREYMIEIGRASCRERV